MQGFSLAGHKPDSVGVTISLGRRFHDGSSGVPGSSAGHVVGASFALHRTGFGEPPRHRGAGGLLPHPFTLTSGVSGEKRSPVAVSFLCHFPSAFAAWDFPSVLPCGVRTFLARLQEPPAVTRPAPLIVAMGSWKTRRAISSSRSTGRCRRSRRQS